MPVFSSFGRIPILNFNFENIDLDCASVEIGNIVQKRLTKRNQDYQLTNGGH